MVGHRVSRRELISTSARGALALTAGSTLAGCSQFNKGDQPRGRTTHNFRLGLDTYMLHHSLTAEDPRYRLDFWDMLERLEETPLTGLQIDPSHYELVPGDDPSALDRLETITAKKGYYVEFGMGGWDPERMEERIRLTDRFGGKALRTFCGHEMSTQEELANYIQWAAPALREAAERTEDCAVKIAVENHGDFTSEQLKQLLDLADHPRVGACLDTGNSLFRKEDPMACAKVLAPYATSMHLKDWFMRFDEKGHPRWREAPLGEGEVPVKAILRLVAEHHPNLYIALESPPRPRDTEAETLAHEWQHMVDSAEAARHMLDTL